MSYVIFRIGHENLEFYIRLSPVTQIASTRERSDAVRFETSSEAYSFAHAHHLDEWRVGKR